jgi:hypothetical protein
MHILSNAFPSDSHHKLSLRNLPGRWRILAPTGWLSFGRVRVSWATAEAGAAGAVDVKI